MQLADSASVMPASAQGIQLAKSTLGGGFNR